MVTETSHLSDTSDGLNSVSLNEHQSSFKNISSRSKRNYKTERQSVGFFLGSLPSFLCSEVVWYGGEWWNGLDLS